MDDSSGVSRRGMMAGSALAGLAGLGLMTLEQARAQGIAPKKGGTLNALLTPEPPVLIMGVNNQGPTLIAASKIFQGLVKYSPSLEPLPELAKSWALSDDKLTYTFHLQPGVTFHDGKPFTADDVIFSIMKFHMELAPRARGVFMKIRQAEAPDPLTVKLTLDTPFEPFMLMFDATTCAMMPKHLYEGTEFRNSPANQKPTGTGPFQFVEWQRGSFIRLRRYDSYWKPGQPYLDEIIYRIVPDSQSRGIALESGQVQLTAASDIEPFDVPRFQKQANLEVTAKGWELFAPLMWLEINHRIKPLDDVRVRRAIGMALDREFLLRRLWFGVGKVATSPIASTTKFYDRSMKLEAFNIKAAAALLDEAGLKPNAQGVRFTMKHLTLPYGEVWTRLAEYFRTALKQVGIEVVLESTDAGGWARRVSDWDYDTTVNFLYQFGDPTLGVERTYVSTNIQKVVFTNTGGYKNLKVDELFATARNQADPAARQAAFSEVQSLLIKDMAQVWLMEMSFPTISDKKLHNVIQLGTGVHASFDDVFIA
ncbi:MAG: ABC transporter substrate-binding protein [Janthinobacterium lividum]